MLLHIFLIGHFEKQRLFLHWVDAIEIYIIGLTKASKTENAQRRFA
jgi:hypothetical protein